MQLNLTLCMRLYGMILKILKEYSFFTSEGVTAVLIIGELVLVLIYGYLYFLLVDR